MKILIVRFSSIGDIVLCSPIVRALHNADHECHFLTKSSFRSVVDFSPHIQKLITIDRKLEESLEILRNENYDAIIDLHKNFRSRILALKLGVKRYSFSKLNFKKWVLVNLGWNLLPDVHIVDRYFEGIRKLGIGNDGKGLSFFIDPRLSASNILSQYGLIDDSYIVWAIGAAHATKRYPFQKVAEVCNRISTHTKIVLLGGKQEMRAAEFIRSETSAEVLALCGLTSIQESALLIEHSSFVISNDTGMMHIAAALKKSIISLWGSTIPAFGMYPYYGDENIVNVRSELDNLPCRPCSKIGFDKCPKRHFNCMNQMDETDLIETIKSLL